MHTPQTEVFITVAGGGTTQLVLEPGEYVTGRSPECAIHVNAELGFAVDVVAVRGSGATPARVNLLRKARADTDYLSRKKAVVWCFSVREFTESAGWQKVPIVKP